MVRVGFPPVLHVLAHAEDADGCELLLEDLDAADLLGLEYDLEGLVLDADVTESDRLEDLSDGLELGLGVAADQGFLALVDEKPHEGGYVLEKQEQRRGGVRVI